MSDKVYYKGFEIVKLSIDGEVTWQIKGSISVLTVEVAKRMIDVYLKSFFERYQFSEVKPSRMNFKGFEIADYVPTDVAAPINEAELIIKNIIEEGDDMEYIKTSCIRVDERGKFTLNKAAIQTLQLEEDAFDGVAITYGDNTAFIGYSTHPTAFKGKFKINNVSYRFASTQTKNKLKALFGLKKSEAIFSFSDDNFKIIDGCKFYELTPIILN